MDGARGAVKRGGRGGGRALSCWGTRPSSGGPIELGRRLDAWLRRQSEATILALGCVLVAACGYADYVAASDLAPLVYLAPLSLVAWYAGWWPAVGIAVASTLAWLLGASDSRSYWDLAVRFGAFLVVGYVVAARRRSLDREEQLARTDPLTGLANLRAFYELADAEIARARRYTHPFTAIYVDLNGFKAINERLGQDRKSTRLNSSHLVISYAVFCVKKNTIMATIQRINIIGSREGSRNRRRLKANQTGKKFRVGIKSNISTNRNNLISGVDRCIHLNAMKKTTITSIIFFFNDTAPTEIYTLSLHDALPI